MRSMRENGGSRTMLCAEKMQRSRMSLLTTRLSSSPEKKRLRRRGATSARSGAGKRPARATANDCSSMSVANTWTLGAVFSVSMCSRSRIAFEQMRDDLFLERRERVGIAEEIRHPDQEVAKQRLDLLGILVQPLDILRQ